MVALLLALAFADIQIEPEPQLGTESLITLLDDAGRPRTGIGIRLVHREDLQGESQASLGLTDSLGRVRWTPEVYGLATVRAGEEERVFVVATPPPATTTAILGVLTLAGLIGLGAGLQRRRPHGHTHRTRH